MFLKKRTGLIQKIKGSGRGGGVHGFRRRGKEISPKESAEDAGASENQGALVECCIGGGKMIRKEERFSTSCRKDTFL